MGAWGGVAVGKVIYSYVIKNVEQNKSSCVRGRFSKIWSSYHKTFGNIIILFTSSKYYNFISLIHIAPPLPRSPPFFSKSKMGQRAASGPTRRPAQSRNDNPALPSTPTLIYERNRRGRLSRLWRFIKGITETAAAYRGRLGLRFERRADRKNLGALPAQPSPKSLDPRRPAR